MFKYKELYTKTTKQPCLCVQSNAIRGGVTSLETFLLKMSSSGYPSPIEETWRCPHLRCPCTTSTRDYALDDTWRRPCLMYPHPRCPCPTSPTDLLSEDSLHDDSSLPKASSPKPSSSHLAHKDSLYDNSSLKDALRCPCQRPPCPS